MLMRDIVPRKFTHWVNNGDKNRPETICTEPFIAAVVPGLWCKNG